MQDNNGNNPQNRVFRSSKQRDLILDVFRTGQAHLSAEDVYQAVRAILPNISLGTVYRNLDILVEQGLINRSAFAGKARYELTQRGHHHHLVCLQCGYIEDIPECPVRNVSVYIQDQNFKPIRHFFEVYGYCCACQDKSNSKED